MGHNINTHQSSNVLFKPEIELQQFSNTKNGLGFGKSQNTVKIN